VLRGCDMHGDYIRYGFFYLGGVDMGVVLKPYYETECGELYHGDVVNCLKTLPNKSVNCCVTSPPYWGLRDYGVQGQIGLESTPEEYVEKMVSVFDEVRRVLKDDGTCWVNLGDSYAGRLKGVGSDGKWCGHDKESIKKQSTNKGSLDLYIPNWKDIGLKPKDLVGIPWRVAFALQSSGWYLRQDIIWHKPNPMPESVKDRCTKAHEYIFLLSKSQKYFYDTKAIREGDTVYIRKASGYHEDVGTKPKGGEYRNKGGLADKDTMTIGRNKRSVWTCTTKPFSGAHFAVFPPNLIEPCILAGCPKNGTVIDPFIGSGTTAIVAYKHDRKFLGIELNQKYLDEITVPRIEAKTRQLKLF